MNPIAFSFRCLSLCLALLVLGLLPVPPAFATDASPRPWTDYRTIMWIGDSAYKKPEKLPLFFQRLREMGVNTGVAHGDSDPRPLLENGFLFYVENMANRGLCLKWNSPVKDWGKHVSEWAKTREEAGLVRPYSLDDPQWRAEARRAVQGIVRRQMLHAPLAYDLRDELSTTSSANPFDYDFSPTALAGFRAWLKTRYPSLEALNAQWQTQFPTWDEVKPFTTDQIKNRMASGDALPRGKPEWQAVQKLKFDPVAARAEPTRWNFSPWADHRTYMDVSLASALGDLRQAAHELDPRTPVGIEGTQMPAAFGGYDLWRLSQVLDWVEPYDIGNAREIFGSFMPGKPILTTVGEQDARAAQRRLWHLLLSGDKGCIIWWSEDCIDWKSDDYALTPRATALAPVLKELTSPLAQLFLRAEREVDPIAIHYSHPSVQVDWLLESSVDGSTWLRRFSSYEASHNRMVKVRDAWLKALTDLGYTPRFLSSEQVEAGALRDTRVLLMPHSLALSKSEADHIQRWLYADPTPRLLIADGATGAWDEHGRLHEPYPFQRLIPGPDVPFQMTFARHNAVPKDELGVNSRPGDPSAYAAGRLTAPADAFQLANLLPNWIANKIERFGLPENRVAGRVFPPLPVRVPLEARAAVHRYRLGPTRLLAFERNISYQMNEDLRQAGGNEALEQPVAFQAQLAAPAHVYDLHARAYLGHLDRIAVTLDPWRPSLFALLPEKPASDGVIEALAKAAP